MRRSAVTRALKRHRLSALVIVLVAALTGLGVGVLVGERGSTAPAPSDEPTPSPAADGSQATDVVSGDGSPSASVVPTAEPMPSSTADRPSPAPSAAFTVDDIVQVTVDGLRMRGSADAQAPVVAGLESGEVARVVAGPATAGGYDWYEVIDLDSRRGWVASGNDDGPWLISLSGDPEQSGVLLAFDYWCEMNPPIHQPSLRLMADGRIIVSKHPLGEDGWRTWQLNGAGLDQVQRRVLDAPTLQHSGEYYHERRPDTPDPPGHGGCGYHFVRGAGADQIVVRSANWDGDEEEAAYYLPSPERRELDGLANDLRDLEGWLGADAWLEPSPRRYIASTFLLASAAQEGEPGQSLPSSAGVDWPFDGAIEQFGDPLDDLGQLRCGYLDRGETFETLRLLRELDVAVPIDGLTGFRLTSDDGQTSFLLTPRSPDGSPGCDDSSYWFNY
jgi:hypothetical protein